MTAPALKICSCILRIAIVMSCTILCMFTSFRLASPGTLGFCVLYYIVKGILAETLVFGARGECDSVLFTLGGQSIFRTCYHFPLTPVYSKPNYDLIQKEYYLKKHKK